MIYQVAIKSLPQDWLWCETWCDDDSKQRAKTIDLVSVCAIVCVQAHVNVFKENSFSFTARMARPWHPAASSLMYCGVHWGWPSTELCQGASRTTPRVEESLKGLPGLRISPCSWQGFMPYPHREEVWGAKFRASQGQASKSPLPGQSRGTSSTLKPWGIPQHGWGGVPQGSSSGTQCAGFLPGPLASTPPACRISGT